MQTQEIPQFFRKNMIGMIVAAMMTILGIIVDGIMISRFLGQERMAAYGLIEPLTNLIMVFSGVLSSGTQVMLAEYVGAGKREEARRIFSMCMIVTVLLSVVLMGILFFLREPIAGLLGASGDSVSLLPYASDYLLGMLFCIPSVLLLFEFNGLMRLDDDPNRIIVAVLLMTGLDILGDILNVFVIHGDMLGMGLSTSIAYGVALFVMLLHFTRKERVLRLTFRDLRLRDLRDILLTGSSSAVGAASSMLRNRVLNGIMLGTSIAVAATAALSILNTILNFTTCIMVGVGSTCAMIAGIVSGRGDEAMGEKLVRVTLKYAVSIGAVISVVMLVAAPFITGLFGGGDRAEMIALATRGLRFYAVAFVLYSLNTSFINYAQGTRHIAVSNVFCFLENFVFLVIPALALSGRLGPDAVWVSYIVTESATFLTAYLYFAVRKRSLKLTIKDLVFPPRKAPDPLGGREATSSGSEAERTESNNNAHEQMRKKDD